MTQRKLHIRTGDRVTVVAGNYKGATGQVLRTIPSKGQIVVDGINMRTHHRRASVSKRGDVSEGGILTFEAPISVSNVMLTCPHCDEPTRVARRRDADGTVERICKRCDNPIEAS
jgi:large subunit ribosomal protein L24